MKITKSIFYNGSQDKICLLGMAHLFLELQQILLGTEVRLLEKKQANGAAAIRMLLDAGFMEAAEWKKTGAGGIDWIKRIRYNESIVAKIGVEIQVSARSDLLIRDVVHLRNSIQSGEIDVRVIVVPSDYLSYLLPDRTPCLKDARRYIEEEFREAMDIPIVVIAVEHHGPGDPLPKKT